MLKPRFPQHCCFACWQFWNLQPAKHPGRPASWKQAYSARRYAIKRQVRKTLV